MGMSKSWQGSSKSISSGRRAGVLRSATTEVLEIRQLLTAVPFTNISGHVNTESTPVNNATIYLDANGNSKLDSGELSTTTDGNGAYAFTNVPNGAYTVLQNPPLGLRQTSPASPGGYAISADGATLTNADFADTLIPDAVTGTVTSSAGPIAGATVYLDSNNGSIYIPNEVSTVTNADGVYSFGSIYQGSYTVRQNLFGLHGYTQVTPSLNAGIVVLVGGPTVTNQNFVDQPWGVNGLATATFATSAGVQSTLLQADGKLLLGGNVYPAGPHAIPTFGFARFNTDGSVDTSFGTNGQVTTSFTGGYDELTGMALQNNGEFIAVGLDAPSTDAAIEGSMASPAAVAVARYLPSGSLDTSFGTGGQMVLPEVMPTGGVGADTPYAVGIQANGDIVIAGVAAISVSGSFVPQESLFVIRLNPDGSQDTSFDNSTSVYTQAWHGDSVAMTLDYGGNLLLGSGDNNGGGGAGASHPNFIRLLSSGQLDTAFGTGGSANTGSYGYNGVQFDLEYINSIVVKNNGDIIVAGSGQQNTPAVEVFNAGGIGTSYDGILPFVAYQNSAVHSAQYMANGDILATIGPVLQNGGTNSLPQLSLVELTTSGAIDGAFGISGTITTSIYPSGKTPSGYYGGMVVSPGGNIFVAGSAPTSDPAGFVAQEISSNIQPEQATDSISGSVFDGRTARSGVIIYLDANNNSVLDSTEFKTVTDSNGNYAFVNLPGDNYRIRQVIPTGYAQYTPTASGGSYSVSVTGGTTLTQQNFVDISTGSISGTVSSSSGVLVNEKIYLDANNNGLLDADEISTLTDGSGNYFFSSIPTGSYTIRQVLLSGYTQVTPASNAGIAVTFGPGSVFTSQNFVDAVVVVPATISGTITAGGLPLSGVTIYNDANRNNQLDSGELFAVSDSSGHYSFANPPVGEYDLHQIIPAGYTQTSPAGGYAFDLASSQTVTVNYVDTTTNVAPTQLTGTVIGTSGSYQNNGNTIAKAFDGNLTTCYDGALPNGNWMGLDLGSGYVITSVGYVSRSGSGLPARMNGGIFQGSNTSDFSSGVVNLYTIAANANPSSIAFTTQTVSNMTSFRYVRYLSPNGSYGNVAELEFFGTASGTTTPPAGGTVNGTISGPASTTIYLDANNNGLLDSGELSTTTNGSYSFSNVPAGSYVVRQVVPSGYTQNTPTSGSGYAIVVTNGSLATGENFVDTANTTNPTGTKLTGTAIGTSGSYQNAGNTIAKALDGNLTTFYDGASANGNWVGLDLGSTFTISQIAFSPRSSPNLASRMLGGIFQGSNTANFSSGAVNLYTISVVPAASVLTTVNISNSTAFRYVRYLSPNGSYGDVSEVQFFGTASGGGTTTPTLTQFTGTTIGTAGSYQNTGNTIAKATDGSLTSFFDGAAANGNWVGLDLGTAKIVQQISFAPRSSPNLASRMVGGVFQASNTADFSSGVVNLYTVTTAPAINVLTSVTVNVTTAYRYYRYVSPNSSYGDVAEIAFYG